MRGCRIEDGCWASAFRQGEPEHRSAFLGVLSLEVSFLSASKVVGDGETETRAPALAGPAGRGPVKAIEDVW